MLQGNLDTTNILLGIMAGVSVLEALVLAAAGYFGYRAYRQVMTTIADIQEQQIAPVVSRVNAALDGVTPRVNAILDDVKDVSGRVTHETQRVDHAIHRTIDRVDQTADRVKTSVHLSTSRVVGIVRGIRTALESFLTTESPTHYPPAGATRVM